MLMELYNYIHKNEKFIGMKIYKLSEDEASRRANIIAVKNTWRIYNSLKSANKNILPKLKKGLKWILYLLKA